MLHTIASTSPQMADVMAAVNSQRELVSDFETSYRVTTPLEGLLDQGQGMEAALKIAVFMRFEFH